MLRKILMASAGVFLLAACEQQQTQAVSAPAAPAAPAPVQTYMVYFNPGQAMLSPEAASTVGQAAGTFKAGGVSVNITGHTDTTGSANDNLLLSQHRAAAVKDALERNGVPGSAITTMGNGEQGLPVQTADNVAERRNRSVEIAVLKQPMMNDQDYCQALSVTYRRYRPNSIDETAAQAMSKCPTADAASAIPVLEQHIRTMNVALPSRALPRG